MPFIFNIPDDLTPANYLHTLGASSVAAPDVGLNTDTQALVCAVDAGSLFKTALLAFNQQEIDNIVNLIPGSNKEWFVMPKDLAWKETGFDGTDTEQDDISGSRPTVDQALLTRTQEAYKTFMELAEACVKTDRTMRGVGIVFVLPTGKVMNGWASDGEDSFNQILAGSTIMQAEMSNKALQADEAFQALAGAVTGLQEGGGISDLLQRLLGGGGGGTMSPQGGDSDKDDGNPFA